MQKMMFNDRYGLTEAVLEKRKTVTRRELKMTRPRSLANCLKGMKYECMVDENDNQYEAPYYVGEIVSVAQSYKDAGIDFIPFDSEKNRKWGYTHRMKAWTNKMFVCADLMPHQIRIVGVRAERLQDITEGDCLREGVNYEPKILSSGYECDLHPRLKFATLIDKIIGRGTWDSNPYAWRIEFELVK